MIMTYNIFHNLIDIAMAKADLRLCNSVTLGSGLRLIPPVARSVRNVLLELWRGGGWPEGPIIYTER